LLENYKEEIHRLEKFMSSQSGLQYHLPQSIVPDIRLRNYKIKEGKKEDRDHSEWHSAYQRLRRLKDEPGNPEIRATLLSLMNRDAELLSKVESKPDEYTCRIMINYRDRDKEIRIFSINPSSPEFKASVALEGRVQEVEINPVSDYCILDRIRISLKDASGQQVRIQSYYTNAIVRNKILTGFNTILSSIMIHAENWMEASELQFEFRIVALGSRALYFLNQLQYENYRLLKKKLITWEKIQRRITRPFSR
jgi:hypothetical protein